MMKTKIRLLTIGILIVGGVLNPLQADIIIDVPQEKNLFFQKKQSNVNPMTESWLSKGVEAYKNKKYKDVFKYCREAIRVNPNDSIVTEIYWFMGITATEVDFYDRAIEYFEKAIKLNPNFAPAYNGLGVAYGKKVGVRYGKVKMLRDAIKYAHKAIELKPQNAFYYYDLGLLYTIYFFSPTILGMNTIDDNLGKAVECYEKAIRLKPDLRKAYIGLILLLQPSKDYNKAVEYCQKFISLDSNNAFVYNRFSLFLIYKKQFEESEQAARRSLLLGDFDSVINLSIATLFQGKYDESVECISKYKTLKKDKKLALELLDGLEKAGIIPEERKADVEKIKKLLTK